MIRLVSKCTRLVCGIGTKSRHASVGGVGNISNSHARASANISTRMMSNLRIAIVGSGPSSFYVAKYLLDKAPQDTSIDIFEKLPTPFGLVRYGVAPDHPEVKSVIDTFNDVGNNTRVQYHGNVELGRDVQLQQLMRNYSAVVLGTGASSDRKLEIPGEDEAEVLREHAGAVAAEGQVKVMSARAFVNWYNGHPHYQWVGDALGHLKGVKEVAIVGHGNVAIDCARILTETHEALSSTDILPEAVDDIAASDVRKVHLIGRRGHAQAAFTIKELREISKLERSKLFIRPAEVSAGWTDASKEEVAASRPKKRIVELVNKIADAHDAGGAGGTGEVKGDKPHREIHLRFLLSPVAVHPDSGLHVIPNTLQGDAGKQRAVPVEEGQEEIIGAQLVLRSVGYKGEPLPGLDPDTFDERRAVIRNEAGRVVRLSGDKPTPFPRLYVTGWCKRGPSGIIGTNIVDAKETVDCVLQDIQSGVIQPPETTETVQQMVESCTGSAPRVVNWAGHERIDAEEVRRGETMGKVRCKIVDEEEMLSVAEA